MPGVMLATDHKLITMSQVEVISGAKLTITDGALEASNVEYSGSHQLHQIGRQYDLVACSAFGSILSDEVIKKVET